MSTSKIVKAAKLSDPVVFARLACTTVNSWIDQSKARPCWTAAVLRRIDQGNNPGHDSGGQQGVLVHTQCKFIHVKTYLSLLGTPPRYYQCNQGPAREVL